MRYYVMTIQHNWEKDAENRTVPSAFNSYNEAKQKFHSQLASDMANQTLDWSLCLIINSEGGVHESEKWTREIVPNPEPEEE